MNTCDTCKFWEEFIVRGKGLGLGGCDNEKLTAYEVRPDGLTVGDSDCDGQRPNTGPKFGCIHHEPK